MLSKLKVIRALEAEGLLKEPTRRKHWVHPFNVEGETSKRFEKKIMRIYGNMMNF